MQTKKFPPLVVVKRHMSDGHGYCGPIALGFGPNESVMVFLDEDETGLSYLEGETPPDMPFAIGVVDATNELRSRVYEALATDTKKHLARRPGHFAGIDLAGVRWSDGSDGAVIFWGGSMHASAVFLPKESGGQGSEVFLNCCLGDDEQPVSVDEASACLMLPSDAEYLRPKGCAAPALPNRLGAAA